MVYGIIYYRQENKINIKKLHILTNTEMVIWILNETIRLVFNRGGQ